jgi:hypothetical protein
MLAVQLLGGFVHVANAAPNYGPKKEYNTTTVMAEHAAKKYKGHDSGVTDVIAVVISTVVELVPVTIKEKITKHVTVGYYPERPESHVN